MASINEIQDETKNCGLFCRHVVCKTSKVMFLQLDFQEAVLIRRNSIFNSALPNSCAMAQFGTHLFA